MLYIALGCAALALFLWGGGGRLKPGRREWRFIPAAFAIVAFTAAAWFGVRGAWGACVVLVVVGLGLAASTRTVAAAPSRPRPEKLGLAEARSILGVTEAATEADVKAAYVRLMRMAHPDKGGTAGLAAQLTAARDRLLRK